MTDGQKQQIIRLRKKGCGYTAVASQRPRCKQQGIKFVALQSSGVFDPRGSRQMCMQACPLGSMLISTLSPGMHISVPSGRLQTPVTSVVLK